MAARVKENQRKGLKIRARDAAELGRTVNQITQRLRAPRDLTGGQKNSNDHQKERGPASPEAEDVFFWPFDNLIAVTGTTETVRFVSDSDPDTYVDVKRFKNISFLVDNGGVIMTFDLEPLLNALDP